MRKRDYTWLVWLIGAIVALGGITWAWYSYMNRTPVVKIPTPTMPKPNAFDYYIAAGKMLKDTQKVDDASAPAKTASTPPWLLTASRKYTLAEKEALVDENAAALAKLREGFAHSYQSPPVRSMHIAQPYPSTFRTMGSLIGLEGEVQEANGDVDGALRSYLDAVRFGEHVHQGEGDCGVQEGYFIRRTGRRSIWAAMDKLDSQQARETAREMREISSRAIDYEDVLQETRWVRLAWLMEEFSKPDWQRSLSNIVINLDGDNDNTWFDVVRHKVFYTKRSMFNIFVDYQDRCVARVRLPYASAAPMPSIPDDPFCAIVGLDLPGMWVCFLNEGQVGNALLTISLALRAYKLDHGRYPADLADLTPHYLKNIPNDPFALKGTYGYKLRGSKYTLYSVGPDKKDDGGHPIYYPKAATVFIREVGQDSRGDIVAGVNTQ